MIYSNKYIVFIMNILGILALHIHLVIRPIRLFILFFTLEQYFTLMFNGAMNNQKANRTLVN